MAPGADDSSSEYQVLGYYDFDTFTLLLNKHPADPSILNITARHEFLHHHLAVSTTFGQLMNRVKRLAATTEKEDYSSVLDELSRACVTVQEMAATYDSLTEAGRTDLLLAMPETYRDVFNRCARLVEPIFDKALARCHYAQALARCAMMTETGEAEQALVEDLLRTIPPSLPFNFNPDLRFEAAEQILQNLPKEALISKLEKLVIDSNLRVILDAETQQELLNSLNNDWVRMNTALSYFGSSLMWALSELLDDVVPGISINYQNYRLMRTAAIANGPPGRVNWLKNYDAFQPIRDRANQTVAFYDHLPPSVRVITRDPAVLQKIALNSVRKTGAIYFHLGLASAESDKGVYGLADMSNTAPRQLLYYTLGPWDWPTIRDWKVPRVTLVEWTDLQKLDGIRVDELPHWLLEPTSCFAHVSGNSIDFLASLLSAGSSVQWSFAPISYENEVIRYDQQLQIVMYAVEGSSYRFFHLSNPSLTANILTFTHRIIGNQRSLRYVKFTEANDLFDRSLLNYLSDHPIFNSAYMFGKDLGQLLIVDE